MIPILLLAAGQSRRMRGADKLLEDVDGQTLLRNRARMALATGHPVFVSLPTDAPARAATLDGLDVTVLPVAEASEGMSGTLRGAVPKLPKSAAFMIMLCDLIALETSDLLAVIKAQRAEPDHLIWRGTTADGKPGHPIIFDTSLRPRFAELKGDSGGESLIRPLIGQTHHVPLPGNRARFDLDTPEDWAYWRQADPS